MKRSGSKPLLESQNLDLEFLFNQQAESAFGRLRAGGVGIEIHYDILSKASEQLGLQFGKRRTGTGDYILKSGGEDGDAVHLAFDQNGVVELLDPLFGEIEIEENFATLE